MSSSDSESGSDGFEHVKLPPRGDDSKLNNSIGTYGSNSYYYAHRRSKEFVVPAHAKVVEGPGIITGGAPVKLSVGKPSEAVGRVRRKIEKYSWCDEDKKVCIYIDDASVVPHITNSDEFVACVFDNRSVCVEVTIDDSVCLCLDLMDLHADIDPSTSFFKVSLGKRITVTLKKKSPTRWDSLRKK